MTKHLFSKRSTDELHLGAADGAPALKDVVERIVRMANLSATDLAQLMGTPEGHDLAILPIAELPDGTDPDQYLRSWESIAPASPAELTETQYARFLRGEDVLGDAEESAQRLELYGAHLEREV